MRAPKSVKALEDLGRVRLSRNFYLRDFLYSEIANFYGMPNVPDDPDLAIEVGTRLCEELLEPIHERFGRLAIRSAYRSCSVNRFGNEHGHNCARNESNYGGHIWDRVDTNGRKGAMACVVAPRFADYFDKTGDWQAMAWWIHDQLPYSTLFFFPLLGAFNIQWHAAPQRRIDSYVAPKGTLTKPGMANHGGSHAPAYAALLAFG